MAQPLTGWAIFYIRTLLLDTWVSASTTVVIPERVVALLKGLAVGAAIRSAIVAEFVTVAHVHRAVILQVLLGSIQPIVKRIPLFGGESQPPW